jgi:hypothetical protein
MTREDEFVVAGRAAVRMRRCRQRRCLGWLAAGRADHPQAVAQAVLAVAGAALNQAVAQAVLAVAGAALNQGLRYASRTGPRACYPRG